MSLISCSSPQTYLPLYLYRARPSLPRHLWSAFKQRTRVGLVDQMNIVGDIAGGDCIFLEKPIGTAATRRKAMDFLVERGTGAPREPRHAIL